MTPSRALPRSEYEARRGAAAAALTSRKLTGLIVTSAPNVRYLTGFTGSNGLVLLSGSRATLFTDPRYELQAGEETSCEVRVVRGELYTPAVKLAARRGLRKLGFEDSRVSFGAHQQLQAALALGASLLPVRGMLEALRMLKSPAEIGLIRESVLLNSEAYSRSIRRAHAGVTESSLAADIDYRMRRLGAEAPAFETIVAFGARTALPHARAAGNALKNNQLVLIDMGASREGYASDMTRMAFLGRPGRKVRDVYRAVLEAQLAALDAVRPGVAAAKVDAAARRVLRSRGLEKAFVHSTGHGLGLEIHEPPRLGRREQIRLQAGMVITIEPGAYIEGFGGVRIEDTVVVTSSGCEILTPTSKELLLLEPKAQ